MEQHARTLVELHPDVQIIFNRNEMRFHPMGRAGGTGLERAMDALRKAGFSRDDLKTRPDGLGFYIECDQNGTPIQKRGHELKKLVLKEKLKSRIEPSRP